jgi:hypothetical protein
MSCVMRRALDGNDCPNLLRVKVAISGAVIHVSPHAAAFFSRRPICGTALAFCFATRQPALSAHFILVTHVVFSSVGTIPPADLYPTRRPCVRHGRELRALSVDDDVAHDPALTVPEFYANALKFCEEMMCTLEPIVFGPSGRICFPPVIAGACVMCYVLDTLVSLLDIARLVAAVLLDGQVLVIGSSLKEITRTILAIRLLGFCASAVPILPSDPMFISLLASPCPFIIGLVPSDELAELQFPDTVMFGYVESRAMARSADPPDPPRRCCIEKVVPTLGKAPQRSRSPPASCEGTQTTKTASHRRLRRSSQRHSSSPSPE